MKFAIIIASELADFPSYSAIAKASATQQAIISTLSIKPDNTLLLINPCGQDIVSSFSRFHLTSKDVIYMFYFGPSCTPFYENLLIPADYHVKGGISESHLMHLLSTLDGQVWFFTYAFQTPLIPPLEYSYTHLYGNVIDVTKNSLATPLVGKTIYCVYLIDENCNLHKLFDALSKTEKFRDLIVESPKELYYSSMKVT